MEAVNHILLCRYYALHAFSMRLIQSKNLVVCKMMSFPVNELWKRGIRRCRNTVLNDDHGPWFGPCYALGLLESFFNAGIS
jgi:hypothetical protein